MPTLLQTLYTPAEQRQLQAIIDRVNQQLM